MNAWAIAIAELAVVAEDEEGVCAVVAAGIGADMLGVAGCADAAAVAADMPAVVGLLEHAVNDRPAVRAKPAPSVRVRMKFMAGG